MSTMNLRLVAFVAFCACIQNASTQTFHGNSQQCALNEFRCYTGQCIDNNLKCNGVANCADGSDEFPFMCGKGGGDSGRKLSCRPDQYRCESGQCIDGTKLCDGNVDCRDHSDEIKRFCVHFSCHKAFRCKYGACIDEALKCDGVANCADGSDESPQLCPSGVSGQPSVTSTQRPSSERPPTLECPLPKQPRHGRYDRRCPGQRRCGQGAAKPGESLLFACDVGYKLNTSQSVYCTSDGTWSVIPSCEVVTCPTLLSPSLVAECTDPHFPGWWPCEDKPVAWGTLARLACRNGYVQDPTEREPSTDVRCGADGQWASQLVLEKQGYSRPMRCVPGPMVNVNVHVKGPAISQIETYLMVCPAVSIAPELASLKYITQISVKNTTDIDIGVQSDAGSD